MNPLKDAIVRLALPTDILHFPRELSSRRLTFPIVFEELSRMWERSMIMSMPTTARLQHRTTIAFGTLSNAPET